MEACILTGRGRACKCDAHVDAVCLSSGLQSEGCMMVHLPAKGRTLPSACVKPFLSRLSELILGGLPSAHNSN